jgi:hypothetical protein
MDAFNQALNKAQYVFLKTHSILCPLFWNTKYSRRVCLCSVILNNQLELSQFHLAVVDGVAITLTPKDGAFGRSTESPTATNSSPRLASHLQDIRIPPASSAWTQSLLLRRRRHDPSPPVPTRGLRTAWTTRRLLASLAPSLRARRRPPTAPQSHPSLEQVHQYSIWVRFLYIGF